MLTVTLVHNVNYSVVIMPLSVSDCPVSTILYVLSTVLLVNMTKDTKRMFRFIIEPLNPIKTQPLLKTNQVNYCM